MLRKQSIMEPLRLIRFTYSIIGVEFWSEAAHLDGGKVIGEGQSERELSFLIHGRTLLPLCGLATVPDSVPTPRVGSGCRGHFMLSEWNSAFLLLHKWSTESTNSLHETREAPFPARPQILILSKYCSIRHKSSHRCRNICFSIFTWHLWFETQHWFTLH